MSPVHALPSMITPAAHWPVGMMCAGGYWMAYWYAWQRAQQLAAAVPAKRFDPSWN